MSIQTTDKDHVALYDSVTGLAKGPTFADAEHAEDFLAWLKSHGVPWDQASNEALHALYDDWFDQRCDSETGILLETA